MFFTVSNVLKTINEWWYQPIETVIKSVKNQQFADSTACNTNDYDSDYHSFSFSDEDCGEYVDNSDCSNNENSDDNLESMFVPIFGKKTYCGEYISDLNKKSRMSTVEHDNDSFFKMSQLNLKFKDQISYQGKQKSNKMPVQSVDSEYKTCYIQYLSLFTSINVFSVEGDIYFRLQKYNQCFILSFFEWALILENREKLIECIKNKSEWVLKHIDYLNYFPTWHHYFRLLRFNNDRLTIKVGMYDSFMMHENTYQEKIAMRSDMSRKSKFSLNRTELSNLLFPKQTTFLSCVKYLVESRLTVNITMVAICNIVNRAYTYKQKKECSGVVTNDMCLEAFISTVTNLFGMHSYHSHVRLREEVDTVFKKTYVNDVKTYRDLSIYATIQDALSIIFPSQLLYLKTIYDSLYGNSADTRKPFSCNHIHCINPICSINSNAVCFSLPY
jgi:hypothetical protein